MIGESKDSSSCIGSMYENFLTTVKPRYNETLYNKFLIANFREAMNYLEIYLFTTDLLFVIMDFFYLKSVVTGKNQLYMGINPLHRKKIWIVTFFHL